MYINIYIYTHTYTYTYTYKHTYTHTYTHINTHIYIHTYLYTHIHIHTYIYTYILTHTYRKCTHTYIYTYAYLRQNPMDNTETQKRCRGQKGEIKQQKSLFHYQQKTSKHALSTLNHQQKSYMSESWNTKLRRV